MFHISKVFALKLYLIHEKYSYLNLCTCFDTCVRIENFLLIVSCNPNVNAWSIQMIAYSETRCAVRSLTDNGVTQVSCDSSKWNMYVQHRTQKSSEFKVLMIWDNTKIHHNIVIDVNNKLNYRLTEITHYL